MPKRLSEDKISVILASIFHSQIIFASAFHRQILLASTFHPQIILASTFHSLYIMSILTEDLVISLCHHPVLSVSHFLKRVVRIPDRVAVKFGHLVTAQEFKNLLVARQRLDADIVNVPTAYQFMKKDGIGYIVMDYVDGDALDLASARNMAEELGKVLSHIHQHGATKPGPLGGGPVSGALWPNHEEVEFSDTDDMQLWFNRRSPSSWHKLDLRRHSISMCHLDFSPRNIMVVGSRIYLTGWSASGYFP